MIDKLFDSINTLLCIIYWGIGFALAYYVNCHAKIGIFHAIFDVLFWPGVIGYHIAMHYFVLYNFMGS